MYRPRERDPSCFPFTSCLFVYCGQGWTFTQRGMDEASRGGHLEMVKWLHGRGAECSTDAMDLAAQEGHLDIVQVCINGIHVKYATLGRRDRDRLVLLMYKWSLYFRPPLNCPLQERTPVLRRVNCVELEFDVCSCKVQH